MFSRGEEFKRRSLEILALATLLSSHLVLLSTSPINSQELLNIEMLGEISSMIQIKKNQESKNNLYNYLPTLTWVVTGSEVGETEK